MASGGKNGGCNNYSSVDKVTPASDTSGFILNLFYIPFPQSAIFIFITKWLQKAKDFITYSQSGAYKYMVFSRFYLVSKLIDPRPACGGDDCVLLPAAIQTENKTVSLLPARASEM